MKLVLAQMIAIQVTLLLGLLVELTWTCELGCQLPNQARGERLRIDVCPLK